jgi:hypothetical protein
MYRECRHIMPTGVHCQSPAMGNSAYCYHHDRLHRYPHAARPAKLLKLSRLDNREAVLAGLTDVMNAILAGKIGHRQGGSLIHGMQVAASNLVKTVALKKTTPSRRPNPPSREAVVQSNNLPYYKN